MRPEGMKITYSSIQDIDDHFSSNGVNYVRVWELKVNSEYVLQKM